MKELYECRNCFSTIELDIHGRCPKCQSDAVISQASYPPIMSIRFQEMGVAEEMERFEIAHPSPYWRSW